MMVFLLSVCFHFSEHYLTLSYSALGGGFSGEMTQEDMESGKTPDINFSIFVANYGGLVGEFEICSRTTLRAKLKISSTKPWFTD